MNRIHLLPALLVVALCQAQSGPWIIYNTSNSGLPSNYVRAIVQDGMEYWIGTDAGAARFDGVDWTVYNTQNSGLPHNNVRAILIDGADKWFGTAGGGIARFDGTNWTVFNTLNSMLPFNTVLSMTMDEEGQLWIGSANNPLAPFLGGAARFDKVSSWTIYSSANSGLVYNNVRTINADDLNDVWFGTLAGLSRKQGNNWTTYTTANSPMQCDDVRALVHDPDGGLWIGTYGCGTAGGALEFDGVNWEVYDTTNSSLQFGSVGTIHIDTCGDVWMGNVFLNRFDGTAWTLYDTALFDIPSYNVTLVTEDDQHRIWAGTADGGIAVFDNDCGSIVTGLDPSIIAPSITLAPNPATNLVVLHLNNMGTGRCDLTVFDGMGRRVRSTPNMDGQDITIQRNGLPAGPYSYLLHTQHGEAWMGSFIFEP
jgi:ligand-binding sensor domain-containing protein